VRHAAYRSQPCSANPQFFSPLLPFSYSLKTTQRPRKRRRSPAHMACHSRRHRGCKNMICRVGRIVAVPVPPNTKPPCPDRTPLTMRQANRGTLTLARLMKVSSVALTCSAQRPTGVLPAGLFLRQQHARLARWSKDRGKEPAMTGAAPAWRGSPAAPSCAAPASACFWSGLAAARQGPLSHHRRVQGWSSDGRFTPVSWRRQPLSHGLYRAGPPTY
jgi:hypothetical protein